MALIRKLVYNDNETDMEQKYLALINQDHPDSYVKKYPLLEKRLEIFWNRGKEWALSYRLNDMTRGNNTNNYAEAGMRIIKELVFGRVKAYNLIQMFQFITTTMEMYYMNRLFDIAHSRYRPGPTLRYRELDKQQKNVSEVKHIRDSIYVVYETIEEVGQLDYIVDMELCTCSCSVGQTGAACRHQAAIAKQYNIASLNIVPIHCRETRQLYATIARGSGYVMEEEF